LDEGLNITNKEMDILNEVASVGAGNATTALSQLINRQMALNIPETILVNADRVKGLFEDRSEVVVGIDLAFFGDLQGKIFLYFTNDEAKRLSNLVLNKNDDDFDESFFKEITNIVAASYINSLAKMCNFEILPSIPHYDNDMLSKIVISLVENDVKEGALNLFVNVMLEIENTHIKGNMLLFFVEESLQKIIERLRDR